MNGNYSLRSWQMLWCECGGNRSGILLEHKLSHLHEGVWLQGVIYVAVVIFLYALGFCLIVFHSENRFNSSTSGGFLGLYFGFPDSYTKRRKHRHRDRTAELKGSKRRRSKEIELHKLQQDSKSSSAVGSKPLLRREPSTYAGGRQEKLIDIPEEETPKEGNMNPLIKVTVEATPAAASEGPPGNKNSSSSLLSFI